MPAVFPDYPAPIVRNADAGRELAMVHWEKAKFKIEDTETALISAPSTVRSMARFGILAIVQEL